MLEKLKALISQEETPPAEPVVPPVAPVEPAIEAPAAVAPPAEIVAPPAEPVPVATALETIIPPPGAVTSAVPTGEAMYMAMSQKDLADLATKNDPTLMALLRGPVTGIK